MSETEVPPEKAVADITEADKYEFLQNIRIGLDRSEAAKKLGFNGRHFRALCSTLSPFYDEEFARSYGEATGSVEHHQFRLERLREEGFRRAMLDSDRLLEKFLMVYDPDFAILRKQDINVNVNALIQQRLKVLPTPLIEQILAALESGETIDADILELTDGDQEEAA
jgi:hypothetical protein